MKALVLIIAILISQIPCAAAGGYQGIGERILFYAAYRAEWFMKADSTMASGASAGEESTPLTFNAFLRYIVLPWPENGGNSTRRKKKAGNRGSDETEVQRDIDFEEFLSFKLSKIIQSLQTLDELQGTNFATGMVDFTKLYPESTDYFDAVERSGAVFENLIAYVKTMSSEDKDYDQVIRLTERAQEASTFAYDKRAYDMDHAKIEQNRWIDQLQELAPDIEWKTREGSSMFRELIADEDYNLFDLSATLRGHKGDPEDVFNVMYKCLDDPRGNYNNKQHWKALEAVRKAKKSCGA